MSYDVSVWCIDPFRDREGLPDGATWSSSAQAWTLSGRGWSLHAGPSDVVHEEDVPEEVFALLPGIRHVVHLSLEPIGAPAAAFNRLRGAAKAIARSARGVILDPQGDTVELPSGVKRYAKPSGGDARIAMLEMHWWFDHASLLERAGIERFLDVLAAHVPEALPRRYGLYEPPQHELAVEGREHFAAFLEQKATEHVIWYPTQPVLRVHLGIESSCGWRRLGAVVDYRCNYLSIGVDGRALEQPGWETALRRLWRDLSIELRPFFGDVRTLSGYVLSRSRLSSDGSTEVHPVCGWWWKGIPPLLGQAAVIGPPYRALWPSLDRHAEVEGELAFVSTADWRSGGDAGEPLGGVPPELALPFMAHWITDEHGGRTTKYPDSYPAVFPFGARPSAQGS